MSDTYKTRMVIVLGVNLALSGLLGYSIWSGAGTGTATGKPEASRKSVASPLADAKSDVNASDAVSEELESNQQRLFDTTSGESQESSGRSKRVGSQKGFSAEAFQSSDSLVRKNRARAVSARPDRVLAPPPEVDTAAEIAMPSPPAPPEVAAPIPLHVHRGYSPVSKIQGITLTAVMDSKAMLSLRREGSSKNEKPEIVCLSPGQKVRTYNNLLVSVIKVEPTRVTFDVDGDRFVKSLAEIR